MIRKIENKDRSVFLKLSNMFYDSAAVLHALPQKYHEDAFDELMRSDAYAQAFILEKDGKAVGYALNAETYSREAGGKVLWLEELFVLEEYRSCGIGREYFSYIEKYAFDNGFARIRLEVEDSNVRARSLYEFLGYRPLEYRQMYKDLKDI